VETALEALRNKRNWSYRQLGEAVGLDAPQNSRRYCLDPDDPEFRRPRPEHMVKIYVISDGEVQPNHFYKLPELAAKANGEAEQASVEASP